MIIHLVVKNGKSAINLLSMGSKRIIPSFLLSVQAHIKSGNFRFMVEK